jgi:hypothetical protein
MSIGSTGDKVRESGTYANIYGKKIMLSKGDSFPVCPKEGKPIKWEKVN